MKNLYKIENELYIVDDTEEINKDTKTCWCIDISCNELVLHQGALPSYHYKHYKKIIMTTDKSINVLCSCGKDCGAKENGVQAIDDEFLECFVKNPSCERVDVESNYRVKSGTIQEHNEGKAGYEYYEYKIIIPKEEPKTNLEKLPFPELVKEFAEYYKNAPLVKEKEEEPKQEKLEETANRLFYTVGNKGISSKESFIEGAKWQQERMYSEEIELINWLQSLTTKKFYSSDAEDLLEQFKKK